MDYIRCMTVTPDVSPLIYFALQPSHTGRIHDYIENPMTATWFKQTPKRASREIVTSELIYYWMIACGIPMECETWHINRLLTLVRVCQEKNKTPRRTSGRKSAAGRQALNAARRKRSGSSG